VEGVRIQCVVAVCLASSCAATLLIAAPAGPNQDSDIPRLISETAQYESGQSMQSLRRLEELIRQSAADPGLRRQIETGLAQLLLSRATPEAKQFACQQLATIGTEASLPALSELLKKEDGVSLACQVLGTHPSTRANDVLRQGLDELRTPARAQIISTLGERQDTGSVEKLVALTNDPDISVATAAVGALGKIAGPPARQAIASLRKNSKPELAGTVVEASMNAAEKLSAAGDRQAAASIYQDLLAPQQPANVRRGAFESLLQLDEDAGEQRILEALRGSDPVLVPVAIAGVRVLRSERASEKFAQTLPKLAPQEQAWLIETLAGRPDPVSQAAVQNSLRSTNLTVRLAAIEGIGKAGGPSSVAPLVEALVNAKEPRERSAIEKALSGAGGGAEMDQALIEAFGRGPVAVQERLIPVLTRRGGRAAIPALLSAADREQTASAAFQALAVLANSKDLPLLLDKLINLSIASARTDAEAAVGHALLAIDDHKERSQKICEALASAQSIPARCSLVRLLPICANAQALEVVQLSLEDRDSEVRDAATRSLADWPNVNAWPKLLELYRHPSKEPYRVLALNALVRLAEEENARPTPTVIVRYRALLESARGPADKKLILGALASLVYPDALSLVQPMVTDPEVRAEAELAVQRIREGLRKQNAESGKEPSAPSK
jgi:HEAT repeat protein